MVVSSSLQPDLLRPGLKTVWGDIVDQYVGQYEKLFDIMGSELSYEEFQEIAPFDLVPEKTETGNISYDDILNGFKTTLTHIEYALGFKVTRKMRDDEQYGVISRLTKGLANTTIETLETLGANIYNRAFNPAYTYGDGVEMCSRVHPLPGGGFGSNEPSVASDLSESSFEQMFIDVAAYPNSRGNKQKVLPTKLFVTPTDDYIASKLLQSTQEPTTNNNAINPAKGRMSYEVNNYFTDPDAWFVRTNQEGLVCLKRIMPEFEDDNEFNTKNWLYSTYFRLSYGIYNWRAVYGSPGAT